MKDRNPSQRGSYTRNCLSGCECEWPLIFQFFLLTLFSLRFIASTSWLSNFWVAGNAMVRLRPPGEGERLCTPWVLLSDLENPRIVTFENFSGYFEVHLSGRVRH